MEDVLAIVAHQRTLHPEVRAVLACVNKYIHGIIKTTKIDPGALKFDDPVNKENSISRTEAKKTFKLADEDLSILPYKEIYLHTYKVYSRYFRKKSVISLRLVKYESLHEKKQSKARAARLKKIEELRMSPDDVSVEDYLANGRGGIREVRRRIALVSEHDLNVEQWRRVFSGADIDIVLGERRRVEELRECLAERNLALRSDSYLCSNYITNAIGDPHSIAREMEIMHILHTKTEYRSVMRRFALYEFHGYWNLIKKENWHELSARAKDIIMHDARYEHLFRDI
ncbi:hypothetical protein PBCVNEJV1_165R [Paramecium bursaria Chlorella virus NE-JV-1]|nr:hypothetical protein PBCVNEJV1_165R [Paramecium bursaria Chlorella virus NE-JV-1]